MDECKPLPATPPPKATSASSGGSSTMEGAAPRNEEYCDGSAPAGGAWYQGLTLVHFSAQRKHILLDTLGA